MQRYGDEEIWRRNIRSEFVEEIRGMRAKEYIPYHTIPYDMNEY